MSARTRWLVLVAVLVLAGVVALWPRGVGRRVDDVTPGPRPTVDLSAARLAAGLRPCPPAEPGAVSERLAGVRARCLGDGSAVEVGAVLAGRATLVNVWATWCGPCRDELPVLQAYTAQPDAIPVLGVQVQSDPGEGLELLATLGVRFPSLSDVDEALERALRVPRALPVSYVVGPDGTVRWVDPPTPFHTVEQVRAVVTGYLEQAGGR